MTENEIKDICLRYNIKNWSLNKQTGLVDVDGSVDLWNKNLTELPLNFGNVVGSFSCSGNKLTTLECLPKFIGGSFCCHYNNITKRHKLPNVGRKIPNVGRKIVCDKTTKWIF